MPTVLLVLGSPNEEIIRISARISFLAFFLSINSVNKRPQLVKMRAASTTTTIDLGPYGTINEKLPKQPPPRAYKGITTIHVGIAVAHSNRRRRRSCYMDNHRPRQERYCNIGLLDRLLSSHLACTRRSSSHRSRHLNALTLDAEASSMLY